jgi:hypothetical protein
MSPAQQSTPLPPELGIPESDWQRTPTTVQDELLSLLKRIDALESRLNRDSSNRWVERVLAFRQTCRIRGRPTFPLLVEALRCRFNGTTPDLKWIIHQEPLLACAAP